MRLISAHLKNFCQHEDVLAEFKPGLNAIVGPNGSGKSTILSAVAGCITGSFSAFPGAKASNIRYTAAEKDKSSASLVVSLRGGQEASITRNLRPTGQKLKLGKHVLTKDDQIEEEIANWLGMPPKTFVEFAFAHQWELFAIINAKPSSRADSLNRLFRLDRVEACRELVGRRLLSLPPPEFINEQGLLIRLDAARARVSELEAQRAQLGERDVAAEQEAHVYITKHDLWETLDKERIRGSAQRAVASADMERWRSALAEVIADVQTLGAFDADKVEGAKKDLHVWDTRVSMLARCQRVTDEVDKHLQLANERTKPLAPVAWSAEDGVEELALNTEGVKCSRFLQTFNPQSGKGTCPECDTPTTQLRERYSEYQAREKVIAERLTVLTTRRQAWDTYRTADAHYDRWQNGWLTRKDSLERQLTELQQHTPDAPASTIAELKAQIDQATKLQASINSLRGQAESIKIKMAGIEGALTGHDHRLAELEAESAGLPHDFDKRIAMLKLLEKAAIYQNERIKIDGQLDICRDLVQQLELELVAVGPAKEKAAQTTEWRRRLEIVKDVCHRESLPRDIAQAYLEQLEAGVNRYLEELGVDFRVHVGEGLSFHTHFPDGRVVPAERLSGGEKVVFALAWRLTVNSAFAADVGLLCLDEPTAGLDSERLGCLRKALEKLRFLSGSHGLQCVIVTHERGLMPMFDHIIELKSPV